jgi:NAD(P)-dependent dehydrogenase (short-subunit alcohol dehydrogenase family)
MKKELLIFGAYGALGRGAAEVLIDKNYDHIYLCDRNPDNKISNPKITKIQTNDLTNEENVKEIFKDINADKGKSFFMFSTVGGFAGGKTIWETELSDFNRIMDMNLKTNFLLAKYFSKIVKDSHSGSIVFTSAYTGINAEPKKGIYGISKSALIHLVKTLAIEGKEINLTVNAIAPYIIDTSANREWMKDADHTGWIKPAEIGNLVNDLFNNYHFITGNVIRLTHRFKING